MSNGISGQDVRVVIAGEVAPPGAGQGASVYTKVNDVTPSGTGPGDPFDDPQKALDDLGTLTLAQQGLVRVFPGTYPGDFVLPNFAHMQIVEPGSVLFTGSTGNQTTPMITMSCCSSLIGAMLEPQDDKDIGIFLTGGIAVDFRLLQNIILRNFVDEKLLNEPIVVAGTSGVDIIQFHNVTVLVSTAGAAIRKETAALELHTLGCSFGVFAGGGKAVQHNGGNWFSRSDDFAGPIDLAAGTQLFVTGTRYDKDLVTGAGTIVPAMPAASVEYDNTASGLAAGNVQDAIDEHVADVANPHVVTLEQARVAGNVLSGIIDMGTNKITNLAGPTVGTDAASKDYVDSLVQGLSWQEPVIDFLATPPGAPTTGDRYVVIATATGAWVGREDAIAEWNGASWDFTTPSDGFAVYRELDNRAFVFADTAWITFGAIIQHAALIGVGTNTHPDIDTHIAATTNPHSVTKAQVGLGSVTDDAQLKRAAADFASFTEKLTPVGADLLLIEDSAASGVKKKIQAANIPGMGEVNTASNQGVSGVGVFLGKSGVDLEFKNIVSETAAIDVTDDTINDTIVLDLVQEEISHLNIGDIGTNSHAAIDTHIAATTNPHGVTKAQAGLGSVTNDAQLKRAAADFASFTDKATPVGADLILIEDSAAGNGKKKVSINNLPGETQLFRFNANKATFPPSNPAGAASRNGHPVLAFDDSTDENVIFHDSVSRDYAEGSLTVDIDWVAASAITGNVKWDVSFERSAPGGQDIDADGFAAIQTATDTTNGTSGVVTRTSITFTQAQADSIAAGDSFRLKITRDTSVGGDMVGDAQILRVVGRQ